MNSSGDAAEQIVRMSINGVEVAAKITGQGAERLAKLLYAVLKDQKRTKGRTGLGSMLKSGKPIKVFAINDKDLEKFCREAKKYGVMYHVLKDKDKTDGKCDIMVRAEDASKINRIFDRFHLGADNQALIRSNIEKTREQKQRSVPQKSNEDKFLDELFEKPAQKEKTQNDNPTTARTRTSSQSEPFSQNSNDTKGGNRQPAYKRPSVRKELNDIKAQQKNKTTSDQTKGKTAAPKGERKKKSKKKQGEIIYGRI